MMIEMPVPFAPPFYKIDLSDLPALVGAFAFGPMTGVLIEFIKILLELVLRGTTTAFVGELANFVVGCSFVMTASIVYNFKKSKGMAVLSCIAGTAMITVVGTLLNAVYLLPAFAKLYGMPLDALIAMGTQVNSSVTDIFSFVVLCVAPLNLLKGGIDSVITVLVYKSLSPILKNSHVESIRKTDTAENNI
jgi:riboflavin transporter FmnP